MEGMTDINIYACTCTFLSFFKYKMQVDFSLLVSGVRVFSPTDESIVDFISKLHKVA